jgi:hypothetical protein
MRDFVFDTPYWFLGLLAVAGVGLLVSGNSRQESRLRLAGLLVLLLGVILALVSHFVDTDKEIVAKRTREVVAAVEHKDRATLDRLLHPRASMLWMTKPDILNKVSTAVDDYHLQNVRVGSMEVDQPNPNEIQANISVSAHVETGGWAGDPPSTWLLVWERADQGWLLRDIKAVKLPGIDLSNVIGRGPR